MLTLSIFFEHMSVPGRPSCSASYRMYILGLNWRRGVAKAINIALQHNFIVTTEFTILLFFSCAEIPPYFLQDAPAAILELKERNCKGVCNQRPLARNLGAYCSCRMPGKTLNLMSGEEKYQSNMPAEYLRAKWNGSRNKPKTNGGKKKKIVKESEKRKIQRQRLTVSVSGGCVCVRVKKKKKRGW